MKMGNSSSFRILGLLHVSRSESLLSDTLQAYLDKVFRMQQGLMEDLQKAQVGAHI